MRSLAVNFRCLVVMAGCFITLMCSSIGPAGAGPYDIMIGCWTGKADVYDLMGQHLGSSSSHGSVYWKTPQTVLHFLETDDSGNAPPLEYDLQVNGKNLTGGTAEVSVTGTETKRHAYFFLLNFRNVPQAGKLKFMVGSEPGSWYNNHYFTSRNRRVVLGSFEPAGQSGQVEWVAMQALK